MVFNTGMSEDDVEEIRREYDLELGGLEKELATLKRENDRLREALNLTLEHAHLYLPHLRPGFSVYDIAKEAIK